MKPQPFSFNKSRIKAFVLGADPTNYSKSGKKVLLHHAFGIGQDPRYFNDILGNLNALNLHLEDLYIQNLIADYQEKETGKNKQFIQKARIGAPLVAKEFNKVDGSKNIPVFLTAYDVYKALLKEDEKVLSAKALYNLETNIPIPSDKNLLNRPLIPLFRHRDYQLKKHPKYTQRVIQYLKSIEIYL